MSVTPSRRRRSSLIVLTGLIAALVFALPATGARGSTPVGAWSAASPPSPSGSWFSVVFTGSEWVAVGHNPYVATSTNGTTWSEHAAPDGSWQTEAYGDGTLVALSSANGSSNEMVSTNGVSWTAEPGPPGEWTGLTYGGGRFVAVGSNGRIVTSTDGTNWTTTFSRRMDSFTSVAFGNGRYVAVDGAQGDTLVSVDATHWAFFTPPTAQLRWGAVTYGDGNFVEFDSSGTGDVATSVMGFTWTLQRYTPAQAIDGATFGCGSFVAVGTPTASSNNFVSSDSGATWSALPVPVDATAMWTSVAYGSHKFVAVDDAGSVAWSRTTANCSQVPPTAPQQVSGNIHNGEVWTYMHPPVSQGSAPVDGYRVTISDGVHSKTCFAPVYYEPNCIIKGLTNRDVYQVTAQAHNRFGYSAPTDPEIAIPVPTWSLNTWTTPVVSQSAPVHVQLTGVLANAEGFYPVSVVSIHFGSHVTSCYPNPFGECIATFPNPDVGPTSMFATYSGYGRSYRSPTARVTVASVTVSPTDVTSGQAIDVSIHGGIARSVVRATIGTRIVQARLNRSGSASLVITAPSSAGTSTLVVQDAGVGLDRVTVEVHG